MRKLGSKALSAVESLGFHWALPTYAVLLVVSLALALCLGAVDISVPALLRGTASDLETLVMYEIRGPRIVLAAIVGSSLALAGTALQGLFRNPLADPGLIGVSSGAALGAVTMIVFGSVVGLGGWFAPYAMPASAMVGAMACTSFLYYYSARKAGFNVATILLVGIAINALAGVLIGFLQYASDNRELRSLVFWMLGSFGGANWTTLIPAIAISALAGTVLLAQGRGLDLMQLGESEAQYLGINTNALKRWVIVAAAAGVGVGVALAGIVGFVGLVVPHLVRLTTGAGHQQVLLGSALMGAALVVMSDTIARTLVAPAEIPVSLVTSAIGAPFFLWLIWRSHPS